MYKLYCLLLLFCTKSLLFAQNWDINTLKQINQRSSEVKTKFFGGIEKMSYAIDIGTPSSMLIVAMIKKDKTLTSKALAGIAAYGQTAIITPFLKKATNRDRPFITYLYIIPLQVTSSQSMPSGHTSLAIATATSVTMCFPKWYVAAPAYIIAGLVGYSRI